jgi:hypothetical protein
MRLPRFVLTFFLAKATSSFPSFANAGLLVIGVLGIDAAHLRAGIPSGAFVDVRSVANVNAVGRMDCCVAISMDGTELFLTSDRPGSRGVDLYRATRVSPADPFGDPVGIDSLNTSRGDWDPFLSVDGLTLYFASDGRVGEGQFDIYSATRDSVGNEFGDVVNLGSPVNGPNIDSAPYVSPDGLTMVFQRGASGQEDLFQATRPNLDMPFAEVTPLDSINSRANERVPTLSSDGLAIFFQRDAGSEIGVWVASRESLDEPFGDPFSIEELGIAWNGLDLGGTPRVSADWPADGSKLYFARLTQRNDADIYEATWRIIPSSSGDVNGDRTVNLADLNELASAIRKGDQSARFDVNDDQLMNLDDHRTWVIEVQRTWYGDADLDGVFDSADIVRVLTAGEYEDQLSLNSTWETGDWNGDGEFDSGDFVVALQDGGYEAGPRAAVRGVPEPHGLLVALPAIGAAAFARRRQR